MRDSPALQRARMLGWVALEPARTLGQLADEVARASPCSEALASLTVGEVVEAVLVEGWRKAARRRFPHATALRTSIPRAKWPKMPG